MTDPDATATPAAQPLEPPVTEQGLGQPGGQDTGLASAQAGPDRLEQATAAVLLPFTAARQLLPDTPLPVALGAGALAIAGVIEWPVAVAVGLGYLALRRWSTPRRGGGRSTPGV